MHDLTLLSTLAGSLAAALVFGWVTQRLGLSTLVGYMLAGILVGPYTPGFVADANLATQMAEMMSFVKKGFAPIPGPADAYFSWASHDDAASAVAAAIGLPAGIYNVVDDEPVTHRAFFDSLAQALNVKPPKLPPTWLTPLFGSLGELLARSLRISNRKLRSSSSWTPTFPSVREGLRATTAEMEEPSAAGSKALRTS